MRNLTIKRTKSFVGCLASMKVYIEDPFSGELTINGIACRKLGDLKNGEEKTFSIGDEEAKVYVISDKLSKNLWNEFYQLPAGQEDISLSGKNRYNPTAGNPFCFDNNDNPQVIANRKRGKTAGLLILIAAMVLGGIGGYLGTTGLFSAKPLSPETFTSHGMSITLTNAFRETTVENFTVAFDSSKAGVFALKEDFSLVAGFENYTLAEYTDLLIKANSSKGPQKMDKEGVHGFVYSATNPETKDTYVYYSYTYKAHDAFWFVQFAVLEKNAEAYEQQIADWAASIVFPK